MQSAYGGTSRGGEAPHGTGQSRVACGDGGEVVRQPFSCRPYSAVRPSGTSPRRPTVQLRTQTEVEIAGSGLHLRTVLTCVIQLLGQLHPLVLLCLGALCPVPASALSRHSMPTPTGASAR